MPIFILVVSVLVGTARFAVPGHDVSLAGSYEAFAHIHVGFLLSMCVQYFREGGFRTRENAERLLAIYCLIAKMFY